MNIFCSFIHNKLPFNNEWTQKQIERPGPVPSHKVCKLARPTATVMPVKWETVSQRAMEEDAACPVLCDHEPMHLHTCVHTKRIKLDACNKLDGLEVSYAGSQFQAWWIQTLAMKPVHLNVSPKNHTVKKENWLSQKLSQKWPPYVRCGRHMHRHTQ